MEKKGLIGDKFKWECMDACCMSFPANHFDRVIDKGVLDAIICMKSLIILFSNICVYRW